MADDKLLVIYNPQAGMYKKTAELIKKELAGHGHDYDWVETTADGRYLDRFNGEKYQRVIVAGGDGTVHHVVNWLLKNNHDVPLAVVPLGSANLLAQAFNLPKNIAAAVKLALIGRGRRVDVGLVNKKIFFLVAGGLGYDAMVIAQTTRAAKRFVGIWAYVAGLRHISEANFTLTVDGRQVSHHAKTLFMMNIGTLLGFPLGPDVSPTDGQFTIAVVRPVSAADYLRLIRRLLTGRLRSERRLAYYQFKRLHISCSATVPLQLDGEEYPSTGQLEVAVVPQRLSLITG